MDLEQSNARRRNPDQRENHATLKASDFTIGWVCALPVELAAAQHMLDAEYDQLHFELTDDNQYFYGKIGVHNVVLACLPKGQIGNNMASSVASQLRHHFPSMRFALMTGVGGGVPSEDVDIRLCDVVISTPQSQYPGVVQYDLGKTGMGGLFTRTGSLAPPPSALLKVVSKLEAKQLRGRGDLAKYLDTFVDLQENGFVYPGSAKDILFASDCEHMPPNARTCSQCDRTQAIERDPRKNEVHRMHFGLIASGNQVIKNAATRDVTSQALDGVLCFEMEAAGLISSFPCLVIRGIADYADSHKNKAFQPWAAAAAAACAKEILYELAPSDVAATKSLEEILEVTREISNHMHQLNRRHDDDDRRKLSDWLSDFDDIAEQNDLLLKHKTGTSTWLLGHSDFTKWQDSVGGILFCPGNPGAGKTLITSAVIQHLQSSPSTNIKMGLCSVYCNYTKHSKQDMLWFLSGMLKQLVRGLPEPPEQLQNLYTERSQKGARLTSSECFSLIVETMKRYSQNFVVIDGLDECTNDAGLRRRFIDALFQLQQQSNANVFATSRFIPEICNAFNSCPWITIRAVEEDICIYLRSRIHELPQCVISNQLLQEEIQSAIVTAADGIFLLADLHLNSLTDKFTVRAIRDTLKVLSKGFDGLETAYQSAIVRVDGQTKESRKLAKQVLSWITYAFEPLTILELQHALAVVEGDEDLDHTNIVSPEDIVRVCEGFVTIDPERRLVRFVHYTVQEFFQQVRSHWLPDGHEMIANTCLTYLTSAGISCACETREDFIAQCLKYPFLAQAGYHWGRHAQWIYMDGCGVLSKILDNPNRFSKLSQMLLMINVGHWKTVTSVDEEVRNELWAETIQAPWNDFHLASWFDLAELTQELLDEGHSTSLADVADHLGRTPLALSMQKGYAEVSRALIASSHISLLTADQKGQTPIHHAVPPGQLSSIKAMLDREDFDINIKDNKGFTALVWAAQWKRQRVALFLLAQPEVNVNAQNNEKESALWYAAKHDLIDLSKALLECPELDPNLPDANGCAPLSIAATNGHVSVVDLLLASKKVDINVIDDSGNTVLSSAVASCHVAVVARLLQSHQINLNAVNLRLETALILAVISKSDDSVSLLLSMKTINVDMADCNGRTALMHAAQLGLSSIAGLLLNSEKANVSLRDISGSTAASIAVEQGHTELAGRIQSLEQ